jgi:hypothetical protein
MDKSGKGNTVLWVSVIAIIAVIVIVALMNKAGVGTSVTPSTTTTTGNQFITSVDLLLSTKDPTAFAANQQLVQPSVILSYWREGATTPVTTTVSGTTATIAVNPGETIRMVWGNATTVYTDEMTIKAPTDVKQKQIEIPTKSIGSVAVSNKWDGIGGTTYTLAAGAQETTKDVFEIKENDLNKAFRHPVIALAYDNTVLNDVQMKVKDQSAGTYLGDYAIPQRLRLATIASENYQKFFDTKVDELDNYATKSYVMEMGALAGATLSNGCNLTITVLDQAKYLGKDGKTLYEGVETANLDSKAEIAASAADVSLTIKNTLGGC